MGVGGLGVTKGEEGISNLTEEEDRRFGNERYTSGVEREKLGRIKSSM